jgi:hypothetical protein
MRDPVTSVIHLNVTPVRLVPAEMSEQVFTFDWSRRSACLGIRT